MFRTSRSHHQGNKPTIFYCVVDRASLYNLVNKANLVHNFLSTFISLLHMFRATMCPSSGEITTSIRRLVFVTPCGCLSVMQGVYQTVIHME